MHLFNRRVLLGSAVAAPVVGALGVRAPGATLAAPPASAVGPYLPLERSLGDLLERIEARRCPPKLASGVPTGFAKFDEMTGGLQPGTLTLVSGRPGMGKTSFVSNVAAFVAIHHRTPVLIFSAELDGPELLEHMLAAEAPIAAGRLRRGFIEDADCADRINPAIERLKRAPIVIEDTPAPSISEVAARARRFRADARILGDSTAGLIVIDYLQLLRGPLGRPDQTRQREMEEISRGVAALAREIHLPILLTLQLSRKRRDPRPLITEREELLMASRFADMLLFIHRDPVLRDRAEIIVAKNRKGPTGTIPILFRGDFVRFQDHVPDPDGTEGS